MIYIIYDLCLQLIVDDVSIVDVGFIILEHSVIMELIGVTVATKSNYK